MPFNARLIFILILLMGLGSCTRKATPAGKLRLNLGAINDSTVINSIYIWGHNKTFGLTFGAHISGDGREVELPLKPGVWNFKVMAWDGDKTFEGVTRCGISPDIAFQSGDVDVPIHISTDCSHPFFAGGGANNYNYTVEANASAGGIATANQIKLLSMNSCRSLALIESGDATECENAYKGNTQSFQVILPSYPPQGEAEIGEFSPESLTSECRSIGDGQDMSFHIPVGDGGPESPRVYIKAYTGGGCSGAHIIKHYPFGLVGAQAPNGKLLNGTAHDSNDASYESAVFFMKHGEAPGGGNLAIFGGGEDGEKAWLGETSQGDNNTDLKAYARRIVSITSFPEYGRSVLEVSPSLPNIPLAPLYNPGDEVMWHVSIDKPAGTCGGNLLAGNFGFARVTIVNAGENKIAVNHIFDNVPNSDHLSPSLVFPAGPASACIMQIIRVPHFTNITATGAVTINTLPFKLGATDSGYGGILPIRIQNKLQISGVGLTLNAEGKGYPYGYDGVGINFLRFQGVGPDGFTTKDANVESCGNDCYLPYDKGGGVGLLGAPAGGVLPFAGGGGGAHVGAGGDGATQANAQAGQGGTAAVSLDSVVHMGASGGHGASPATVLTSDGGGAGGGIILLFAREIVLLNENPLPLTLNASGEVGKSKALDNPNGGGGGAAGSIWVATQYLDPDLTLNLNAAGGNGGEGQTGQIGIIPSGVGGGGGGGGRILFEGCHQIGNLNPEFEAHGGSVGASPGDEYEVNGSQGGDGLAGDLNGTLDNIWNPALPFCP